MYRINSILVRERKDCTVFVKSRKKVSKEMPEFLILIN